MASGGGAYSEPRSRQALISRLLNTDEDVTSTVSAPAASAQDRLNNWDFSNWKPNSSFDNTKRPKRANEEKGDGHKKRNKENLAASSESSPVVEGNRHKTPSTFPRTKITPVMPMSQRMALENLRQHITFSDMEESIDGAEYMGERNNERFVPRRDRPIEMSLERNEVGRTTEPSRDNRNMQRQLEEAAAADTPDSTEIVGRLMQIRGYMKEASSMMEKLQTSGDPSDHGRAVQLEQVINRLREQEQKYLELLLKLSTAKEDLLERQNSLQRTDGPLSQLESESEAATELEVDTDTSENEDAPEAVVIRRPRIEDKLGLASDPEQDNNMDYRTGSRSSQPETPELDATLVSESGANAEIMSKELLVKRKLLESDLTRKNEELSTLKEQHDLLKQMLEQQEQLRDLQGRQSTLMMLQREAESQLEQESGEAGAAPTGTKNDGENWESVPTVNQNNTSLLKSKDINQLRDNVNRDRNQNSSSNSNSGGKCNNTDVPREQGQLLSEGTDNKSSSHGADDNIEPIVLSQDAEPVVIMQNMILGDGGFPIFPSNMEGQFAFLPNVPRNLSVVLGNSGTNLIVGDSEEQLVMPNQPITTIVRDDRHGVTGDGGEISDGDEVVETYKIMYVVEWCEEEESDGEKSQTSCKIMELENSCDIEDAISDISKPKSQSSDLNDDAVSESSRTRVMSPISEIVEECASDLKALGVELTPQDYAHALRSDISEAGSSQVGPGQVSELDEDEEDSNFENLEDGPQELKDLRQRLDYLKNLYETTEQEPAGPSIEAASDTHRVLSAEKAELQDKLTDLLQKKSQMDQLLGELQSVKGQPLLNNDVDMESETSSTLQHLSEGIRATAAANMVDEDPEGLEEVMEARAKLQKLQEVKDRLNQLKGLVQYYQTGNEFIHGAPGEDLHPPEPQIHEMTRTTKKKPPPRPATGPGVRPSASNKRKIKPPPPLIEDDDSSESASQLSSNLGVWGDDPVIQEKVRRLKEAKEKLHRLQELVAMVQSSPDGAQHLPDDLAELAASLEMESGSPASFGAAVERREGSLSLAGAVAAGYSTATTDSEQQQYDQQEAYYQMRMTEQKVELESLMGERKKLLSLQQELQRLHDTIPQNPSSPPKVDRNKKKGSPPSASTKKSPPMVDIATMELLKNQDYMQTSPNNQQLAEQRAARASVDSDQGANAAPPGTGGKAPESIGVTFQEPLETVISNEELYGRMRQQRMLREELREKKKELEDMMRKDRPRKQYSRNQDSQRNQDNQSDNISYSNRSTELFGGSASVDQTMATWGGSTVDNLESIEEDEGNSGDGQEADDDGYPSDGIIQVEEEEEQVAMDDSDDRDTYTIEEEPYMPKARSSRRQISPPEIQPNPRPNSKKPRGAPFQGARSKNGYNYWDPDNSQVLNNVRSSGSKAKAKKKEKENELKEQLKAMKEQIDSLKESLVTRSQPNLNQDPVMNQNLAYMSSLQQQQMMLSLSQFHNQMMSSQQEMGDRLGRLERSFSTSREFLNHTDTIAEATRRPYSSHQNSPRDAMPPATRGSLPHYLDSYAVNSSADPRSRNDPFQFSPYFPDNFPRPTDENSLQESPLFGGSVNPSNGGVMINNTNNNHMDALRLESVLNRDLSKERNPFNGLAPYQSSSLDAFAGTTGEESDSIPIETIQAKDTRDGERRMLRLNLDHLVKEKGKRYESNKPSAFYTHQGDGSITTPSKETQVIGEKFPTPSRATAAARLASQKVDEYKPGVSAGISGTAYDTASISSVISSEPGAAEERKQKNRDSETGDFSLFEALRETIYSEVATLISQNESRPHYLIELFRELQLMGSDYLRQRALYAIQDLATQQLTEESLKTRDNAKQKKQDKKPAQQSTKVHQWPSEAVNNELTPGLSAFISEADVTAKLCGENPQLSSTMREHSKGQTYDCNENVEESSFLNTPDSACYESPFAQDSLGDTVIHRDKTLQRMGEFGCKLTGDSATSQNSSPLVLGFQMNGCEAGSTEKLNRKTSAAAAAAIDGSLGSSAQDNGSDGSVSDVPYPRIDTQHLDQQIKAIMTEIIPVLNEHMDDVCSQQLLHYIKRLVLSLAQNAGGDQAHEFVRFFNKQLGSILQDSLSKFDGRKMRDCGEDLMVDLSEILFNELAFFRLMQDLDDPKIQAMTNPPTLRQMGGTSAGVSRLTQTTESPRPNAATEESSGDESDTESSSDIDERPAKRGSSTEKQDLEKNQDADSVMSNTEEEELGKARDDEMAAQTLVTREEDRDDEEDDYEEEEGEFKQTNEMLTIQLVPSETKPMNRIGSDEDDEGDDESRSCEDPSDTAVSHDFGTYSHDQQNAVCMTGEFTEDEMDDAHNQPPPLLVNDRTKEEIERNTDNEKEVDTTEMQAPPSIVVIDGINTNTTVTETVNENHLASETKEIIEENHIETNGSIPEVIENNQEEIAGENSTARSSVDINDIEVEGVGNLQQNTSGHSPTAAAVSQAELFQAEASSPGGANSTVIAVNGEENQQEGSEEGALTMEDLPPKLQVDPHPKDVVMNGEPSSVSTASVLEHVAGCVDNELAGDPQALKEPEPTTGTQV